jgi:HD-GYP domain-containing protein (c-di-GMP phosphodiesterase class II)
MGFGFKALGMRAFLLITAAVSAVLGLSAGVSGGVWVRALAVMIVAAAAFAISRSISRSLAKLTAAAGRAARTGCISEQFPAGSAVTEINSLAEALNSAARSIHHSQEDLDRAHLQFIETLAEVLDARDPYTAGHSLRVAAYSHSIACAMNLPADEAETIRIAAQLHDIGKVGIPDAVLQKPGSLSPKEFGLIKLHPQIGRRILEKMGRFHDFLDVVELHHENFDGSGYPYGFAGDRIPLSARIVRVADAFDSMVTHRHYRGALPVRKAIEELRTHAGTQFDPGVGMVALRLLESGKWDHLLLAGGEDAPLPVFQFPQGGVAVEALVH